MFFFFNRDDNKVIWPPLRDSSADVSTDYKTNQAQSYVWPCFVR